MKWFREQLELTKEEIKNSDLSEDEKYSRLLGISFAIGLSKGVDLGDVQEKESKEFKKELAMNMSVYVPVDDDYIEDEVHDNLLSTLKNSGYAGQVYEIREQNLN